VGDNIASILDEPARLDPGRVALVLDDGSAWSYRRLQDEVSAWAATLASAGVRRGQRVPLVDWGGARSTAVTLAAAHLGAATAQMNPLLTAGELRQLVEVADCSPVAITTADDAGRLRDALGDAIVLTEAERGLAEVARDEDTEADALVLFTSGTTGLPKPVYIRHDHVMARIRGYRQPFAAERAPATALMCVPSFHVGGILGLLLSLYGGDTTVIQPRFEAGGWLELVERHRVTSAFVVPTMLSRILDRPDVATKDLSCLARLSYGAAAAPTSLVARAMEQWPHVEFSNVFGQTETLGAYTALSAADHRDPRRVGSVGRPMPGVEIRIVEPDTDDDVEAGTVGELWVRSSQNVNGDWLQTGDLAYRDRDGYVYPQGRRGDLINRGGEKFAPVEVAEALRSHPLVRDVAVAGVPDDEMGHRVGALVVLEAGTDAIDADDLRDWARGRLAPFKLPEVVRIVDALPANELGKLPARTIVEHLTTDNGGTR
jgi:acyl-CoA synthetase (AMP-forming)/AMP-acid ligase II